MSVCAYEIREYDDDDEDFDFNPAILKGDERDQSNRP